jgi:Rps23 Pro-64 3,4-dihydroxylase Tpa1-like proline 4-hydroxylase
MANENIVGVAAAPAALKTWLSLRGVAIFVLVGAFTLLSTQGAHIQASAINEDHIKSFKSAGVNIYQISNFLPTKIAQRWRTRLRDEWLLQQETCPSNHTQWTYATNTNGSNAKERSLERIPDRREQALQMKQSNMFAYAKWELEHGELFHEMQQQFLEPEIIQKVQTILSKQGVEVSLLPQLSDFFVTQYSPGDFLSKHNDYLSGSWAFVVSLMDKEESNEDGQWQDEYGGHLRFECPTSVIDENDRTSQSIANSNDDDSFWCTSVAPSFNTALIFQTGQYLNITRGPYHEVLAVSEAAEEAGYRRFSITGWYVDEADYISVKRLSHAKQQ